MSSSMAPSQVKVLVWSLAFYLAALLVGFVGMGTALPRAPGVPIGGRLVGRSLEPFGRDLSVGITLVVLLAVAIGGSVLLGRLHAWWAVIILVLLSLVIGLAFISFSSLVVSNVFI